MLKIILVPVEESGRVILHQYSPFSNHTGESSSGEKWKVEINACSRITASISHAAENLPFATTVSGNTTFRGSRGDQYREGQEVTVVIGIKNQKS